MSFINYFIGSNQSKYSAVAIFSAILAICAVTLFINDDISFGSRIGVIVAILFFSIIPVGISLFNLTCMVTGDKKEKYNPCGIWAWVTAIIIIINCFILIISAVLSVSTYKKAYNKIVVTETFKLNKEQENKIAENIIKEEEPVTTSTVSTTDNIKSNEHAEEKEKKENNNRHPSFLSNTIDNLRKGYQQTKSLLEGFDDHSNNYAPL